MLDGDVLPVYYIGTHHYSFRSGEAAEIVGVQWIEVNGDGRPCFRVRFADGKEDLCPISDQQNYKLAGLKDVRYATIQAS